MQTLSEIKQILEEHGLSPKRSLGQNFLIDHNLIRKLVDESGVQSGDVVLEVGPGTGTLTEEMLARGCRVVACELDDDLSRILRERAGVIPGGDKRTLAAPVAGAVERAMSASGQRTFSLVANLPYGAATPLMMTLMTKHPACRAIAVTIQREVVDRLTAAVSTPDRGALSVVAQALCEIRRIALAPRECFWPRPDVTSAMVLLKRRDRALTEDVERFSEACRVLFAHRRKQIGAALGREVVLPAGVDGKMRAEELTVEQVEAISRGLPRGS